MEMKSYCFSFLVENTLKTIVLVGNFKQKQIREYLSHLQEYHYYQPNLEKLTEEFFNVNNKNQDKFSYIINENVSTEQITKFIIDSIYNKNFKFMNDMLRNVCDEAYFIFDGHFKTTKDINSLPIENNMSFIGTRIYNGKENKYDYKYFFQFTSEETKLSTIIRGSMTEDNVNLGLDDDVIEFKDLSTSECNMIPTSHFFLLFDMLMNLKYINNHLQLKYLIDKNTCE